MKKIDVLEVKASLDCDLSIQKIIPMGDKSFKIIASHANKAYSNEQYMEAVASMTDNKMRVVPNSIKRFGTGDFSYNPHVQLIVKANLKSKSYNDNNVKGLKVIASNVFMSEEDNAIWKKVGEGEEARLVQTSDDDYEAILNARKARNITTVSSMIEDIHAEEKDYVAFYNDKDGKVEFGVMASDGFVVERSTESLVKVEPKQIVEAVAVTNDDTAEELASIDTSNLDKMLNYMKVLYGAHPEFFDRLESLIKQRGSMGYEGGYISAIV